MKLIKIWLEAEQELRKGNEKKCLELKNKFTSRYIKLNKEQQQYIKNYLDSIAA